MRIANLIGDSRTAIRLSLEVKPIGGHPPANAEDTRRFLVDKSDWQKPDGITEHALQEYFEDRKVDDETGKLAAHSLEELEFWIKEALPTNELPAAQLAEDLTWRLKRIQIIDRTRSRTYAALCGWERELSFAATNEHILSGHVARVHARLAESAPQVLDKFNAVFRRLQEATEGELHMAASEELAQAVTSCRRVLKGVVDVVQPVDPSHLHTADGHALNDEAYKNRLFEFLKDSVQSETFSATLTSAAESLFERFAATDRLASKGVHASVARDEAEFCAANTYLLAGELLTLSVPRPSPAESAEDLEKPRP